MIFICEKQKLQEGISIVQKAITGKSTMSVLEGIYINANKEGLTLIGSDMDVSIETKVEADVINEGSIVIDAKIFGEIIRKLPNSDIKIETLENDTVQITCEKSVFNVVYMNADEFPELPQINQDMKVEVPQNILKNMIKGTSFAIAQDETRPILQGVLFEVKDKTLNLVALDGYRLAIRSEYLDSEIDIEKVIPGKTLNEVSKILEDINDLIKLEVQDEALVITSNSQLGKVREEVLINLQGDKIQIAFNSRYLIDVLKNFEEEEVILEMTSSVSPCIIKAKEADNYKYLVLPVRLIR